VTQESVIDQGQAQYDLHWEVLADLGALWNGNQHNKYIIKEEHNSEITHVTQLERMVNRSGRGK
jgi:hypothetical protein